LGSAVVPTLIANAFYLPRHLLPDVHPDNAEAQAPPVPSLASDQAG